MWNDLTMSERADVIKMAVKAGLRDMKSIRKFYDDSLKYAEGGSIHIAPSKRGTFTAAATKHGMGVQEFASKVLANKDNYSPAMVKKANFARNFGGHKHDLGGYLFEEGGPKNTNREYKSANSWNTVNAGKALAPILEPISRKIMNMGEKWAFPSDFEDGADLSKSTAQDTYLLPRNVQRAVFLNRGYQTAPKDYGLVEKAVNRRNIPVYQKAPDDISRDKVVPMLNVMAEDTITETENWFGRPNARLEDPGSFPTTFYISTNGKKIYQKGWDLNDYEDTTGRWYQSKLKKAAAKGIDLVGNPTVVTTGISEVGNLTDLYEECPELVEDILTSKGLIPLQVGNDYVPSLPNVTITGKGKNKKADGGDITYLDTVRMDSEGNIADDKGNVVGDSVVLPELTVRAHKGYKSSFNPYILISPNNANIINSIGKGIVKGVSSINKKDAEPIREAGITFLNNLNPKNRLDALDVAMHSTQGGEVMSADELIKVGIPNYIKKKTGKPMDINYTGSYLSDGITPNTKRDLVNLYLKGDTTGFEDVTDNSYYHNGPDYKEYFKKEYPNINPRTYKMYSDGIPLELNEEEYEEAMNNLNKIIRVTEGPRNNADNIANYNRWYKTIDGKLYAIDSDVWDFNPKDWSWEHGDEETVNKNGTPFILKAIRPVTKKKASTSKSKRK